MISRSQFRDRRFRVLVKSRFVRDKQRLSIIVVCGRVCRKEENQSQEQHSFLPLPHNVMPSQPNQPQQAPTTTSSVRRTSDIRSQLRMNRATLGYTMYLPTKRCGG